MKFRPTPFLKLLRRLARSVEENGFRGALVHSYQRFFRSLKSHGLGGTFSRAFIKAPVVALPLPPEPPHPFDLRYGTDTGGYYSGADMQGASLSSMYTTAYYGVAPSTLTSAISSLSIDFKQFTFVDVGCGKGRALMIAAQFPFPQLQGVEISPKLCQAAEANIKLRPEWASRITIINKDATKYQYPNTPLLIFMFHPFLRPVLRRVLSSLESQLRRAPREAYLLYARNPRYTDVLEKFPLLHEISETAHPLSQEDAAVDHWKSTHENFTLYSLTFEPR